MHYSIATQIIYVSLSVLIIREAICTQTNNSKQSYNWNWWVDRSTL